MHSTDFTQGKVWRNIVAQSIPLTLAQLVQLLYNVVDRIYIGHLPGADSMALTGIGLAFPLTTLIAAFTFLFGSGGTPLFPLPEGQGRKRGRGKFWAIRFPFCLARRWCCFCSVICSAGRCFICSAQEMLLICMPMHT